MLAGAKRSGKDTIGLLLKQILELEGKTVELISFATPLKFILATTLGISLDELTRLKDEPSNPHRSYLQRLGTEAMKPIFGETVWVDIAKKTIKESTANYIIITDFRFPQEHLSNSTTIKVIRDSIVPDSTASHISEQALNDFSFDKIIHNNSSIPDLVLKVKGLI
jgi:hypothetical protein